MQIWGGVSDVGTSCLCAEWDEVQASKLKGMLEASIQRRFPKGLKVRVRTEERNGCLTELAQRLRTANLSITRAKVRIPGLKRTPACEWAGNTAKPGKKFQLWWL